MSGSSELASQWMLYELWRHYWWLFLWVSWEAWNCLWKCGKPDTCQKSWIIFLCLFLVQCDELQEGNDATAASFGFSCFFFLWIWLITTSLLIAKCVSPVPCLNINGWLDRARYPFCLLRQTERERERESRWAGLAEKSHTKCKYSTLLFLWFAAVLTVLALSPARRERTISSDDGCRFVFFSLLSSVKKQTNLCTGSATNQCCPK